MAAAQRAFVSGVGASVFAAAAILLLAAAAVALLAPRSGADMTTSDEPTDPEPVSEAGLLQVTLALQ